MSTLRSLRKICVVVGSRANYSSIKSALTEIQKHPSLELQLVVGASALLDRYGSAIDIIERDGFTAKSKIYMLVEGETPSTMAKSTGVGLIELSTVFENLKPDVVLTIGDRFETMATTLAAAYMNIPLAHTMGGEVSGNIDENIRHAITKFANIHFAACEDAKKRIIKLGEDENIVHNVGCPRMDLVAEVLRQNKKPNADVILNGVGPQIDLLKDFLLVSQHPVTGEYGSGETQILSTLEACLLTNIPTLVLWPNSDAGAEQVSRGIRKFREQNSDAPFHYIKNLSPEDYIPLMKFTKCLIGNSSSAIREGPLIGTPAVNIGSRQVGRQRGKNIIDVSYVISDIKAAIEKQICHGPYNSEPIYGNGDAGAKIAELLSTAHFDLNKTITF